MEIFLLGILLILGALIAPVFTLGCVVIYLGHPIIGVILIVIALLDTYK